MTASKPSSPLLTIAIPTFNRADLLDLCLSQICKQLSPGQTKVELIVSDNNSTDNTKEIVDKYLLRGFGIRYIKNQENTGPDRNIFRCFDLASGKYVLVFGSDDVLLDGSIGTILNILENGEYGIVYLNSYGFFNDYIKEKPKRKCLFKYIVYNDVGRFIQKVNIMFTFISANVVNKDLVDKTINFSDYLDTNMAQTSWILSAVFNAKRNMCVEELMLAAKQSNTGGYALAKVFAINQNKVFDLFIKRGIGRAYFRILNAKLLQNFFPYYILSARRSGSKSSFFKEDYFEVLRPVYHDFLSFWIFTVPAIKLPLLPASIWVNFIVIFNRASKLINKWIIVAANILRGNFSGTLFVGRSR
jgi:abequosyltransferase